MIERFQGEDGRRRLVEALRSQPIVEGNEDIVQALADVAEICSYVKDAALFNEGESDNHIAFILNGTVSIRIKGSPVNTRRTGQHVGEMALIDARARRSATVVAVEPTVVATVREPAFTAIADSNPRLWRLLAVELADRLRQRGIHVRPRNAVPQIFIGSSSETEKVAHAIAGGLAGASIMPIVWAQGGVFGASQFPIESLDAQVEQADFAALVLGPDDVVVSRRRKKSAPRDNVVFELGLFMGRIKRERTYLIVPKGLDIKIPTDLLGITQLRYDPGRPAGWASWPIARTFSRVCGITQSRDSFGSPADLKMRLEPVCKDLNMLIRSVGPR